MEIEWWRLTASIRRGEEGWGGKVERPRWGFTFSGRCHSYKSYSGVMFAQSMGFYYFLQSLFLLSRSSALMRIPYLELMILAIGEYELVQLI